MRRAKETMPTIQVEAQVSTEQLLRVVEQMPTHELNTFVASVLALRAQREAPHLSQAESDLLLKINHAIPPELQQRYNELISKRRAETLSAEEHTELLNMTDQIEKLEADRVAALADLARLRHTSVPELIFTLGIEAPTYA
jgi:hypothetical protein